MDHSPFNDISQQLTAEQIERYLHFLSITNTVIIECDLPLNNINYIIGKEFLTNFIDIKEDHFTDFIDNFKNCVHQDDFRKFNMAFSGYLSFKHHPKTIELDHRIVNCNGAFIWVHTLMIPFYQDDILDKIILCINDIDTVKKNENQILFLAEHDGMTGLLNKISIEKCIESTLKSSAPNDSHILLMVDLDNFKTINDSISHEFGDKVLINCTKTLESVMGDSAVIGRYGGDEFLLLIKNQHINNAFFQKIQELSEKLAVTYEHKGNAYNISASIGIATFPKHGQTVNELESNADYAMYYAKNNGKNRYALFHDYMPNLKTQYKLQQSMPAMKSVAAVAKKITQTLDITRHKKMYLSIITLVSIIFILIMAISTHATFNANQDGYVKNLYGKAHMALVNSINLLDNYGGQINNVSHDKDLVELLAGKLNGTLTADRQSLLEKEISDNLDNFLGQLTSFEGISIQDISGTYYLQDTDLPLKNNLIGENINPATPCPQKYNITFCRNNEKAYCIISSPIYNATQELIGYLHLVLNENPFKLAAGNESEFIMFVDTATGIPIYNNSAADPIDNSPIISLNSNLIYTIYTNMHTSNNSFLLDLPSGKKFLASSHIENGLPLAAICAIDYKIMQTNSLNFAIVQIIATFSLLLLLAFLMYKLYTRTNEPITKIIKQCSLMALGDDNVTIDAQQDKDLNILAQTINTYHAQVKKAAYIDSLLQIGNRVKCYRDIDYLLAVEPNKHFSVFMWDIIDFSSYNTIYSTQFGDKILQTVVTLLQDIFHDQVYRINGDVFVGIYHFTNKIESQIIEDLHNKFSPPLLIDDIEVTINYRFGISNYPGHGCSANELLQKAQIALNYVKKQHNKFSAIFDNEIANYLFEEQHICDLIKKRIADNTLEVWYQPIYDTKHDNFTFAEALLRLRDENNNLLSPLKVITVAEKFNVIDTIDNYVLHHSCKFLQSANINNLPLKNIHINLSVQELLQPNCADKIKKIISSYDISPSQIGIELTETVLIESFAAAIITIKKLQQTGIKIALDDFGSGYSSLTYLAKLPIDAIKLDRELILQLGTSKRATNFIEGIIKLAKIQNLLIVAEGVETLSAANLLINFDCDYIQGYHYSKPLPAQEFCDFLRNHRK